jgi:hypothetical protein
MPDEIHHPDGRIEHPSVRYERTDASFGCILSILIAALIFGIVAFAGVRLFFDEYRNYQAEIKKSPYPLAPEPSTALPREPRLEQIDRLAEVETPNVHEREAAKEKILNSYGATQESGFVHVPIERAMSLLADKLPVRAKPPANQTEHSNGLIDAGESNAGRVFRRRAK